MNREGWLMPYIRAHMGRFIMMIILGVLTAAAASMLMFTSGFLISKSALRPENILLVYVPIVGVRTFGISRAVLHYVERLVSHDAVLRILSQMRVRLFRVLEPQALMLRSKYRTGDILGLLADDIEQLQNVYLRSAFPGAVAVVIYAGVIAALGRFDGGFALMAAALLLILLAGLPLISLMMTARTQVRMKQERSRLYQRLTDAVMGLGSWVISGRAGDFLSSYEEDEASIARADRALKRWARIRNLIGQLIVLAVVLLMMTWSAKQTAAGQMDGTFIAAFTLVVFPLMDVFLPLSEAAERLPGYRDSLNRLEQISSGSCSDSRTEEALKSRRSQTAEQHREQGTADGSWKQGSRMASADIRLEDVSFSYKGNTEAAVHGLSLDIPQGKRIAVIGRSGAGKSTLLGLIQGAFKPDSGTVRINGTAAADLGEDIPRIISVLNQRPHLFDTTLANNIRLGRVSATDEDVRRAAEQAQLAALAGTLPGGYDTPMREMGQRFSGGERQRVALARILLQDTPVVILDEPTVGLDPRTERELLKTILRETQGKSLIWVTHHLALAESMDEIIFMEGGRIEMRGTHAELMERYPRYRNLYRMDRPGYALERELAKVGG
ncbi:thiol reductant ABC exporter subunit CydC [Paenibacillus tuaregi]|uniref:thiol reductant ABC exporter subunit CydC n=1 Tax=Paenibacillus tuaregi TaxID=1816681 RepID=UPI000838301F|nr:thiol reductant ABC exporter subunit CydC [Paenibacillus tuaregi]